MKFCFEGFEKKNGFSAVAFQLVLTISAVGATIDVLLASVAGALANW